MVRVQEAWGVQGRGPYWCPLLHMTWPLPLPGMVAFTGPTNGGGGVTDMAGEGALSLFPCLVGDTIFKGKRILALFHFPKGKWSYHLLSVG